MPYAVDEERLPLHDAGTKRCNHCHELKPRDQFARRSRSADGLQAHCRICGRQALDSADAKRRAQREAAQAPRSAAPDWEGLEALLADRADEVAVLLFACAMQGIANVLQVLADQLCGDRCPWVTHDDEDTELPDCLLHALADHHAANLYTRLPASAALMTPAWARIFGTEPAPRCRRDTGDMEPDLLAEPPADS